MVIVKRYIQILLSFLLFLSFITPVDSSERNGHVLRGTLKHQNYERTFDYYIPSTYTGKKKVPLMLSFHGRGSDSEEQRLLTSYDEIAEREGFIVVFPNSTNIRSDRKKKKHQKQWNDGRIDTPAFQKGVDDVGFTEALIDYFTDHYEIDVNRVYATGMSNGAFFVNRLAVELSDRIAGIGAVAGTLAATIAVKTPKQPTAVVLVMGDSDPIVPYEGFPGYILSADETITYWLKANNNNKRKHTSKPKVIMQTTEKDPTQVLRTKYKGSKNGAPITLYTIKEGGHTWPGGPQYAKREKIGRTSTHMNASEIIWNELKKIKLKQ